MTRLLLVTPDGWWRIPLPDAAARRRSVTRLVERQFRGVDDQPLLRRSVAEELAGAAEAAAAGGGLEMYVATDVVAGVPLSASLVVTAVAAPRGLATASTASLARRIAEDGAGEVAVVDLPCGPAVRHRRVGPWAETRALGAPDDSVAVDYLLPVPGDGGWVVLSFSTPLVPLAEPMADLFEALASTARWEREAS